MSSLAPPPELGPGEVACPKCGGHRHPAVGTRRTARGIRRIRRCGDCGREFRTREVMESTNHRRRARPPAADLAADGPA